MYARWILRGGVALWLVLAFGVAVGSTPAAAQITNAKATHVGDPPSSDSEGESSISLTGRGSIGPEIDLSGAVVTITQMLDETGLGGAGELLGSADDPSLPLVLLPRAGSSAENAVFATPSSTRPQARFAIRRRSEGQVQFLLKISRAIIPTAPALCGGDPEETRITTQIALGDGVHAPAAVLRFTQPWECRDGRLRISNPPPPGPSPTPTPVGTPAPTDDGNQLPTAHLRTEQLTRATGQPNVVLLDGTDSSDPDGQITAYEFSVVLRSSGSTAVPPTTTGQVTFEVTLPPGDYVARLRVKDDHGAFSGPVERGFSLH